MKFHPVKLARNFLFALIFLESALRGVAALQEWRAARRVAMPGARVLLVGDAHALLLRESLAARLSRSKVELHVAGDRSLNSTEARHLLPDLLAEQKPEVALILVGEANFWNRKYLADHLRDRPGVLNFLSEMRVYRLLFPHATFGTNTADGNALPAEEFVNWARRDLVRLVRSARESGVAVALVTYPPLRYTGRDRAVNAAIRSVASDLHVPLSDPYSDLSRSWNGRALENFYEAGSGDHLNTEGSAMAADIVASDLLRTGILKP